MYQLTENPDLIIRLSDGASIPRGHRWFREYEAWVAEGNTPEPVPVTPVAERREQARAAIDGAAGRARLRFVPPGSLVDQEYRETEAAAIGYRDAGYPATPVPAEVQAWVDATGWAAQIACDDIIAKAQLFRDTLAQVRQLRLIGKAAVDSAADADIETTRDTYVNQLKAIVPPEGA